MTRCLITSILASAFSVRVNIPALVLDRYLWRFNTSVSVWLSNETISVLVEALWTNTTFLVVPSRETSRLISADVFTLEVGHPSTVFPLYIIRDPSTSDYVPTIAMGRGSYVLNQHSSVAIFGSRSTPTISLGIPIDEFAQSCRPGSLLSLQLDGSEIFTQTIGPNHSRVWTLVRYGPVRDNAIAELPLSVLSTVGNILAIFGVARCCYDAYFRRYTNCHHEVLQNMPNIVFSINRADIILEPQDYIKFGPDGTCEIRFAPHFDLSVPANFNPMMIPDLNARLTNTDIQICDPLD